MVQSQVPSSASTVLNSEIFRVDGTFEARSEDCPTGHCASEMINKCPSLIHLMVVTRADGRTIPGIHEGCHEERMMSLCHDAQCDHPPSPLFIRNVSRLHTTIYTTFQTYNYHLQINSRPQISNKLFDETD